MSDAGRASQTPGGEPPRPRRPAALFFDPPAEQPEDEHFFDLENITDPKQLLHRATELATAFQAAAERAVDFQAIAAAQLADPTRFDRLTLAQIADRAGWTEDYAAKMIEHGRRLQQRRP